MINNTTECHERKINFIGNRIAGSFFFFLCFLGFCTFFSSEYVVKTDDILKWGFLLLLGLFIFTLHATFDNSSYTLRCCFFKKTIPLQNFTYFRYSIFGYYSIRLRQYGKLNAEGPAFVGMCSRKAMKPFLVVLHEKNPVCQTDEL